MTSLRSEVNTLAIGVAVEISAAVIVVGILIVGMVRLFVRSDLDATEPWKRLVPFVLLGCGLILIAGGWYGGPPGIASVLEMAAGAAMAGNGAYLAIRSRGRQRPSWVPRDEPQPESRDKLS